MERIVVAGLEVFAYHGCNPEERRDGQVFLLDLELSFDSRAACRSDDLADTVNYAQAAKQAAALFAATPCNLIEHAAWRTARGLVAGNSRLQKVAVRVHKPNAPLQARVKDITFEIVCGREED